MSRVPGTNLLAVRTAPRIETFITNAAISVGDLVFMAASNKVGVIAAGTNITTANTVTSLGGIVGIALTAASATDLAIQVQIIDSETELILPNSGASTTPTTAGNTLYVLNKPSSGTYSGALTVDLATTTNGVVNVINKDQDALGMQRLTTGTASGIFSTNPALVTPTLPIATGDLVRVIIPEANRWYKG